jgi:hypothetical protein
VTTVVYGSLLWLAGRRVVRHLKENQEEIKAVTERVLLHLLGRRPARRGRSRRGCRIKSARAREKER